MPNKQLILRTVKLTLALAWPILLLVALGTAIHTETFLKASLTAPATITALDRRTDADGTVTYVPTFTFQTPDGRSHSIASDTGSNPPGFEVGQPVSVKYKKDDPSSARLNSFVQLWLTTLVCSILGVVFLLLYVACRALTSRRNTKALSPA